MPNQSLFLKAVAQTPDAVERLSALATKVAAMSTVMGHSPVQDPLDNPDLGPDRVPDNEGRGRNLGGILGTLGGAALGGLAAGSAGHLAGDLMAHPIDSASDLASGHMPHVPESIPSTIGAGVEGAGGAAVGGLAGHFIGSRIGAGLGRASEGLYSPARQAAEKIKRMDPAAGLAHIQMMEQSGHVSPEEIQAMKDAYNTRRHGLLAQLQHGMPVSA